LTWMLWMNNLDSFSSTKDEMTLGHWYPLGFQGVPIRAQ
jgi:hypothetical protein